MHGITIGRGGKGRLAVIAGVSLLAAACAAATARSFELRVVDDTLSIHAADVPLQDVLRRFQEAGVRVRMDLRINPPITADFDNRDMYKALAALLADCDYAITWASVDGPAGPMKRIAEIQVFRPGDRKSTQPLPGNTNLNQSQDPVRTHRSLVVKDDVLVRLRRGTSLKALKALLAQIGGTVTDSLPRLGLYRVHLVPGSNLKDVLDQLAANPDVEAAEPNYVYKALAPQRAAGDTQSPLRTWQVPAAGSTVPAVAVLDTGLMQTPGLNNAVVASYNAIDPELPISDTQGHGTQMALIASGIAPLLGDAASAADVPVVPIRVFDDNGYASSFGLMQSMLFALDHQARVISLSWGSDTDSQFIDDAVSYATGQGAVVVAAAGNEPTGKPFYPAACSNVLAVSALNPDGSVWTNSNYGSFVSLAAPSFADLPVGYKGPAGTYVGTSIATAYTANAIARYLALHPAATASQAVAALTASLTPGGSGIGDPHYGAGKLDGSALTTYLK